MCCHLTPAHDLRGRGASPGLARAGWVVSNIHHPTAAPRQVHALVRPRFAGGRTAANLGGLARLVPTDQRLEEKDHSYNAQQDAHSPEHSLSRAERLLLAIDYVRGPE